MPKGICQDSQPQLMATFALNVKKHLNQKVLCIGIYPSITVVRKFKQKIRFEGFDAEIKPFISRLGPNNWMSKVCGKKGQRLEHPPTLN